MARKKFELDPNRSARENLWEAARLATFLVMKRHRWYGLDEESRQDLFMEITMNGVVSFMYHKIRCKKYNHDYSFLQNVISSVWSASSATVSHYFLHVVGKRHVTTSLSSTVPGTEFAVESVLTNDDALKYYDKKKYKAREYGELPPKLRANLVKNQYRNYIDECVELGVTSLRFQPWLTATGYGEDHDMLFYLMPKEDQREVLREEKQKEREAQKTVDKIQRRIDKGKKYEHFVLPYGWEYVEKDGVLCIQRKTQ